MILNLNILLTYLRAMMLLDLLGPQEQAYFSIARARTKQGEVAFSVVE